MNLFNHGEPVQIKLNLLLPFFAKKIPQFPQPEETKLEVGTAAEQVNLD